MARPRKTNAVRGKTGRIKTSEYRRQLDSAEQRWARIRDTLRDYSDAPRLTDELGRLHFMGMITSAQYQAARSFGVMLETYDRRILGVKRTVPAHGFERSAGASSHEEWDADDLLTFKKRFEEADKHLKDECGRTSRDAVAELCRGNYVPLANIGSALDWLVTHFRIDPDLRGEPQIAHPRARAAITIDATTVQKQEQEVEPG